MVLACGGGILCGAIVGSLPRLRVLMMPMVSSLYAIPLVILYPVFNVVPDDPIEVAADHLVRPLGAQARGDADFAIQCAAPHPLLKHFEIAAGERDFRQVNLRHGRCDAELTHHLQWLSGPARPGLRDPGN